MKIAFVASAKSVAQHALQQLTLRYGQSDVSEADYIVSIGGDGTVLKALHAALSMPEKPVFAMRLEGSVGFLTNHYDIQGLHQRLETARKIKLRPLKAEMQQAGNRIRTALSINEIVLMRQRLQAAKLKLTIGGTAQVS